MTKEVPLCCCCPLPLFSFAAQAVSIAQQILEGTFVIPDDVDDVTVVVLEAITHKIKDKKS